MNEKIKIFSGNGNLALAEEICERIGVPLGAAEVGRFSDGEIRVEIDENVRGKDVFIIQSISAPVNENLMELLVIIDALKRASADRTTVVIPYYAYARQDRKVAPRAPISSKLVADLLTAAGASRILSIDLHAAQIQGFFNIPFDHLYAMPVLLRYMNKNIREVYPEETIIVSPDAGGVERARAYAKRLQANLAIIDKRRDVPNVSQVMNIIGEVKGKNAILLDDLIDTAGTMVNSAQALKENGAKRAFACCTHPVLSGPAIERIGKSVLEELIVTNTIPLSETGKKCEKIKVLSVANLLGDAIMRIHNSDSIAALFV